MEELAHAALAANEQHPGTGPNSAPPQRFELSHPGVTQDRAEQVFDVIRIQPRCDRLRTPGRDEVFLARRMERGQVPLLLDLHNLFNETTPDTQQLDQLLVDAVSFPPERFQAFRNHAARNRRCIVLVVHRDKTDGLQPTLQRQACLWSPGGKSNLDDADAATESLATCSVLPASPLEITDRRRQHPSGGEVRNQAAVPAVTVLQGRNTRRARRRDARRTCASAGQTGNPSARRSSGS